MINIVFKLFQSLKKDDNLVNQYDNAIKKALELQKPGFYEEALEIYSDLYLKLNSEALEERLALVINNMIVIKYELKQDAKELYEKLYQLRLKLMHLEENYAIDYIKTILMGVDWFGLPKSELYKAKSILERYRYLPFYKPVLAKIDNLYYSK